MATNNRSKITAGVETITPAIAKELLEQNRANFRKIDKSRVRAFASDMLSGKWDLNGEPIIVGQDGVLRNGQHRLAAVVQSQVTIPSLVVRGVESDGRTIDTGKVRTAGQWLSHKGISHANAIAAAARLAAHHDMGLWTTTNFQVYDVSRIAVLDYAERHAEHLEWAARIAKPACKICSTSLLAAIFHLGTRESDSKQTRMDDEAFLIAGDLCVSFVEGLKTGINLDESEPVLHLRNRLIDAKSAKSRMTHFALRMYCTLAWNKTAFDEKTNTRQMLLRFTGPNRSILPSKVANYREMVIGDFRQIGHVSPSQ